jgi:holliday junction DNA helicase RuvA
MIVRLKGKIVEKKEQSVVLDVQGLCYEVMVPLSVHRRLEDEKDRDGCVELKIYHYLQMEPSRGFPVLIGFLNDIERDFFQAFIKVAGIGPRAAVRALNKPISQITRAIDESDIEFLKTLNGIGLQRAREIVAKLQGKVGRFGLIQDKTSPLESVSRNIDNFRQEALTVLLQLQYKKPEALSMIDKALQSTDGISSTEDLLNYIYKQRVKS